MWVVGTPHAEKGPGLDNLGYLALFWIATIERDEFYSIHVALEQPRYREICAPECAQHIEGVESADRLAPPSVSTPADRHARAQPTEMGQEGYLLVKRAVLPIGRRSQLAKPGFDFEQIRFRAHRSVRRQRPFSSRSRVLA